MLPISIFIYLIFHVLLFFIIYILSYCLVLIYYNNIHNYILLDIYLLFSNFWG